MCVVVGSKHQKHFADVGLTLRVHVATFQAVDDDTGSYASVSYSIRGGNEK